MQTLREMVRVGMVTITLFRSLVVLMVRSVFAACCGHDCSLEMGESLTSTFETLGGAYVKLGQILSTRGDILSEGVLVPLRRLQDSQARFSVDQARLVIERSLGKPVETLFRSFDSVPIGSASIAQVHHAVLQHSGAEVAVKVRRPGIDRTIKADSWFIVALVRALSLVPPFRGIPVVETVQQATMALKAQASLRAEADLHRQFFALFESGVPVRVPRLFDEYCTDEVLVMEYFPHLVKLTAPEIGEETHRTAVIAGLHGLYKMLFVAGLVHCDLHPGNVLVGGDGKVVVIDFGFATQMPPSQRSAFTEFFLSIALGDGIRAANIVLSTALRIPTDLNRASFEREISNLVRRSSGLRAGEFLISSFVSSLFSIQQKHGIYGAPSFTMAILSLIVYEGTIRHRCADLDFQREAIPILMPLFQKS
jgi:ubiquinone biosynthesis protein